MLANMFSCEVKELEGRQNLYDRILNWLGSNTSAADKEPPLGGFLETMDSFDLDDYIKAIHFNDIKLPTVPFSLPTTKRYRGLKEMMECELDFIKATVFSKSTEDVFVYTDMPI